MKPTKKNKASPDVGGARKKSVKPAAELMAGYLANAERDLAIAAEWVPLEDEVDARLAKAEDEIKKGQGFGPFDYHEDFLASLHKEAAKLDTNKHRRRPR